MNAAQIERTARVLLSMPAAEVDVEEAQGWLDLAMGYAVSYCPAFIGGILKQVHQHLRSIERTRDLRTRIATGDYPTEAAVAGTVDALAAELAD